MSEAKGKTARRAVGSSPGALARLLSSPGFVVAVGALLRVVLLARMFEPPDIWDGDPATYAAIVGGLRSGLLIPATWIWPPGFPLLALPFSFLLGAGNALQIVSLLAGVALPAVLLRAGRLSGLAFRGTFAAWIVAVHPEAVLASARPLSESSGLLLTVLAAIFLEAAGRRRSVRWGLGAGAVAGVAVLTRPELVVSMGLLGAVLLVATRRRPAPVIAYGMLAALIIAPYVLRLHAASGAWTLSLKLPLNVQKHLVYQRGDGFVQRRLLWERYLDETVHDERGNVDPRRLVQAFDSKRWLFHPEMPGFWLGNVGRAFRRDPPLVNVLWIAGIAGLLFPGGSGRRERTLAAVTAAPLLAVPVLFPPVERYALVALPAFAWGTGTLVERLRDVLTTRGGTLSRAVVPSLGVIAVVGGTVGAVRGSRDSHWVGRGPEVAVAMARGDLAAAERLAEAGLRVDAGNPLVHEAVADVRAARGDSEGTRASLLHAAGLGGDAVRIAAKLANAGWPDDAERVLDSVRGRPPQTAEYWALEGNLALARGRWVDAAAHFGTARDLGGPADRLSLLRGRALVPLGRLPQARREFERAAGSPSAPVRDAAAQELARLEEREAGKGNAAGP